MLTAICLLSRASLRLVGRRLRAAQTLIRGNHSRTETKLRLLTATSGYTADFAICRIESVGVFHQPEVAGALRPFKLLSFAPTPRSKLVAKNVRTDSRQLPAGIVNIIHRR